MSFLPEYEDDLFISYAHLDNKALTERQKGWVSKFHHALQVQVDKMVGAETAVWLDEYDLRGNDTVTDKILQRALPNVAILISVVTPRYLESDWCLSEVREFYRRVQDRSRLLKVVLRPAEWKLEPPELQGYRSYEFFQLRKQGSTRELTTSDRQYFDVITDLSHDISLLLRAIRYGQRQPTKGVVYLAQTTVDLQPAHDGIRRDLQQRQYEVLPDKPLPFYAGAFEKTVRDYLQRSSLSIHLVGENYGMIPEAENRSVIQLQHEIAAERSRDGGFARLIWMPVGLQPSDERQRQLVRTLQDDVGGQPGAEIVQTGLEEFKSLIEERLSGPKKVEVATYLGANDGEHPRIYVIADTQDVDARAVDPICDYLFHQDYEPVVSTIGEDEAATRELHEQNLRLSSACLIYYGLGSELWLRAKMNELLKARSFRSSPMAAAAVYIAAPETRSKQSFRTHEAMLIRNSGAFSADDLAGFLAAIEGSRRAQA